MYTDITGYSWSSFWNGIKEWFEEENIEIFASLAIAYFGLSYLLPNGFAFAASASIGSMIGGIAWACVYIVGAAVIVYGVIKLVEYFVEGNIVMPGDEYESEDTSDEIFI